MKIDLSIVELKDILEALECRIEDLVDKRDEWMGIRPKEKERLNSAIRISTAVSLKLRLALNHG